MKRDDKTSAFVGGIGTGCLVIKKTGETELRGAVKVLQTDGSIKDAGRAFFGKDPLRFALYVNDGEQTACKMLTSDEQAGTSVSIERQYAFVQTLFDSVPGLVCRVRYFNPFIPLNTADSAIPAAFAECLVENTGTRTANVSLVGLFGRLKQSCAVHAAYHKETDTFGVSMSLEESGASVALAADARDFTFSSVEKADNATVLRSLSEAKGFLDNSGETGTTVLLASHFTLHPGESKRVRYVASWYFPELSGTVKTYYSHYFTDALSCATYCFLHFERLKAQTGTFVSLLEGSSLPAAAKAFASARLDRVKHPDTVCEQTGKTYLACAGAKKAALSAEALFPALAGKFALLSVADALKEEKEVPEPSPEKAWETLCALLLSFSHYRRTGTSRLFAENFPEIARLAEKTAEHLPEQPLLLSLTGTYGIATMLASLAELYADAKTVQKYREKQEDSLRTLCEAAKDVTEETAPLILLCEESARLAGIPSLFPAESVRAAASKEAKKAAGRLSFAPLASLIRTGQADVTEKMLMSADESESAVWLMPLIDAFGRFSYDKMNASLTVCPCETGNFPDECVRQFVCFDGAFGYAEEGVDYCELHILSGDVKLRSFGCAHRVYKVQYGGRNLPCTADGTKAYWDSPLTVDAERKLTLLIDISK